LVNGTATVDVVGTAPTTLISRG